MPSLNECTLLGHLGADPEIKFTNGGMAILEISLSTTTSYKKGSEWIKETDWHKVKLFGDAAKRLAESIHKGSLVLVKGRIKYENWEKDGVKRWATTIMAHTVLAMDRKDYAAKPRTDDIPQPEGQDDIPF